MQPRKSLQRVIELMKKIIFITLGYLSFFLGTVGIFLPVLPTVPFYLLTAYLWFNSSDKLHHYLMNNRYYKQYIQEAFLEKKLTLKKLIKILIFLFILLAIPAVLVNSLHVRMMLCFVYIAHVIGFYIYFYRNK